MAKGRHKEMMSIDELQELWHRGRALQTSEIEYLFVSALNAWALFRWGMIFGAAVCTLLVWIF